MAIRIAVGQFRDLTEERLRFAAQIGATGIQMNNPNLPGEARWEEADIRSLVETVEAAGLRFEAIENVPTHFYHKAMLGLQGRDEQIENYRATIRAVARAGVPVLGYHFMPNSVWTTSRDAETRGGATARRFEMAEVEANADDLDVLRAFMPTTLGHASSMPLFGKDGPHVSEDQMWANYRYFIEAVLPVAEEEGLRLALHPDDPPVPMLGGVARLFYKPENFRKAYEMAGRSKAWALDLCLGCCSEMPGGKANVREMIEHFGPLGAIAYIHFRDVKGTVPDFTECFIGDGNFDPAEVIALLASTGFDGFLLDDHVPKMDGDSDWNHRGRSHAIGYMQGLVRMAEHTGLLRASGAEPTS
ncbi:mannonate dehydratase [Devosia pacifica]|nr:mannonate dehydratase [Devosia pacifica]